MHLIYFGNVMKGNDQTSEQLANRADEIAKQIGIPQEFLDYIGSIEFVSKLSDLVEIDLKSNESIVIDHISELNNQLKQKTNDILDKLCNECDSFFKDNDELKKSVRDSFESLIRTNILRSSGYIYPGEKSSSLSKILLDYNATKKVYELLPEQQSYNRKLDRLEQLKNKKPKLKYENSPKLESFMNVFVRIPLIDTLAKIHFKRQLKNQRKKTYSVDIMENELTNIRKISKGMFLSKLKNAQQQATAQEPTTPPPLPPKPRAVSQYNAYEGGTVPVTTARSTRPNLPVPSAEVLGREASASKEMPKLKNNRPALPKASDNLKAKPKPISELTPQAQTVVNQLKAKFERQNSTLGTGSPSAPNKPIPQRQSSPGRNA